MVAAGYIHYATAARVSDIPDELKVSLYRNDLDPRALRALGGRNATLS
jgi:hypothetical protein